MQRRPLHGSAAKSLKGDGLWLRRQIFLPWLESLLCFVSGAVSLEQEGVERPARLGQGSRCWRKSGGEEENGEGRAQVN